MPEPRRAVVFSGGGAKGIFESGVVHALAQTGYQADVITGSSVGALNAIGYAETLRAGRQEGSDASLKTAESLLALWQEIDRLKVADLDRWGWRVYALGGVFLVLGTALLGAVLSIGRVPTWLAVLELTTGILLGAAILAAGLALFVVWSLLPKKIRDHVWQGRWGEQTRDEASRTLVAQLCDTALRLGGFLPSLFGSRGLRRAATLVVPAHRRLSEYRESGLDVRLTRTNLRTGRTEISEALEPRDVDRPGFDRGLRVLGDPRAVAAALASSAFPGAFPPVCADDIYVPDENRSLYARARDRSVAKKELKRVFGNDSKVQYVWLMSLLERLADDDPTLTRTGGEARLLERIRSEFFGGRAAWNRVSVHSIFVLAETRGWPQIPLPDEPPYADRYLDGGILDNTPLSTALRALREGDAGDRAAGGESAETSEMIVVLLSPRARRRYLSAGVAARLSGPALGLRALRLQAERRLQDDVRTAERIDHLLGQTGLVEEDQSALAATGTTGRVAGTAASVAPPPVAPAAVAPGAESWSDLFSRERGDDGESADPRGLHVEDERLVRVQVTRVYPTWDLPWLFSLDDRLGFDREHARAFQVRGCRDTLTALAATYGKRSRAGAEVPPGVRRALELTAGSGPHVASGWICSAERCTLRAVCDRVAAEDKAGDTFEGAVARA